MPITKNEDLPLERAERLLKYNPETGTLIWKESRGSVDVGDEAGGVSGDGYVQIRVDGTLYMAHRIAWLLQTGSWPTDEIDHIDGHRANNSWGNLREVTRRENHRNKKLPTDNRSGHIGVYWSNNSEKWCAEIRVNGSKKHLGYYEDINDAIAARAKAEKEYDFHYNHGRD